MSTEAPPQAVLHRCVEFDRAAVDESSRRVRIAVSSETAVERYFGDEVLDHSEASVMLGRLKNRAPLLLGHDPDRHIGVVERAWIEDKRLRAEVRLSKSPEAEAIFQDILDGIRSKISVGYQIKKFVLEKKENDRRTYRITLWEPLEVSIVSVPADDSVGVGRQLPEAMSTPAAANAANPAQPTTPPTQAAASASAAAASPPPAVTGGRDNGGESERIARFIQAWPSHRDAGVRAIASGMSFVDFVGSLQEGDTRAQPGAPAVRPVSDPNIGMNPAEVRRFSIVRAIANIAMEGGLRGIEKEASDAFADKFGLKRNDRSFFIPWEVQRAQMPPVSARSLMAIRDLQATVAAAGGVTVPTEVLGGDLIEMLRARLIMGLLGARTMFGLQGNVSIPKVTAGASGQWLAETAPITPSSQTFDQVPLSPKRYGAATAYTRQLVVQSAIDVEAFVRDDLAQLIRRAFDAAALTGTGADGQPRGITNTTGVGAVTFGAAPTWAKVVQFETEIAMDDADIGTLAYVASPAVRGRWKTTLKAGDSGAGFLWHDWALNPIQPTVGATPTPTTPPMGMVNGYRAIASTLMPNDRVLFGNFSDLIIAMWIPLEIIVDPYTKALNHEVMIVVNALGDVGVRQPQSFVYSTDSGNQA